MTDMSVSTEEKKEMAEHSVVRDVEKYPYGLRLHLDSNSYKKLGISEVPTVGDKVAILAYAEVCDVHQNKYEGDEKQVSIGLQITDMEIKEKENDEDKRSTADKLYGSDD